MNYKWTQKEIADTRAYWYQHDLAVIQRKTTWNRIVDVVYYTSLISVVTAFVVLFSR